jgi:hypothetical protein
MGQPVVLTEFGGIAYAPPEERDESWGYSEVETSNDLERAYSELLETVRALPLLAGFCYTQFADTYQERNGLLYADRTPKFPIERIAEATTGPEFQRLEAERRRKKAFRKSGKEATVTVRDGVRNLG